MKSSNCIWYVSGFKQPWEADVISNLAEALRNRGVSLRVYVKGGTAHMRVEEVLSWNSLTFFERMKEVLFGGGKLWHLWGDAPIWWSLVRLRARTVHTSLSAKPSWRGHPTRLFKEQAQHGENRILPTFEPKAAWTDFSDSWLNDELDHAVLIPALDNAGAYKEILASWASIAETDDESFHHSKVLVADGAPSNVLHAAFMTMRGVPVVAWDVPLIREVLGPGGYVVAPPQGDRSEWKKALLAAASDVGRSNSAAARRFLNENFASANAAESLESLYESVSREEL